MPDLQRDAQIEALAEQVQGAAGEAVVRQDRCGHLPDALEVLLDFRVRAGLWWGHNQKSFSLFSLVF